MSRLHFSNTVLTHLFVFCCCCFAFFAFILQPLKKTKNKKSVVNKLTFFHFGEINSLALFLIGGLFLIPVLTDIVTSNCRDNKKHPNIVCAWKIVHKDVSLVVFLIWNVCVRAQPVRRPWWRCWLRALRRCGKSRPPTLHCPKEKSLANWCPTPRNKWALQLSFHVQQNSKQITTAVHSLFIFPSPIRQWSVLL